MTQYFTEEMQKDQILASTDTWKATQYQIKNLKNNLLNKLMALAVSSIRLHDACIDPLLIKGLCLALDYNYREEDGNIIQKHCDAVEKELKSRNFTANQNFCNILNEEGQEVKELKLQALSCLLPIAQNAYSALLLGEKSYHVNFFFYQTLGVVATETNLKQLEALISQSRKVAVFCMEFLEKALSKVK